MTPRRRRRTRSRRPGWLAGCGFALRLRDHLRDSPARWPAACSTTGWSAGAVVLVRIAVGRAGGAARSASARCAVAGALLRAQRRPGRRRTASLAVAGAQFCYFSAVTHMQVGPALLIEYTAPAAVVVWLWLRHGQRPGPVTLAGAGARRRSGWCWCSTCSPVADLSLVGRAVGAGRDGRLRDVLRDLRRRGQRPAADRPGRPAAWWSAPSLLGARSALVGVLPMRGLDGGRVVRRPRGRLVAAAAGCSAW